ncbi:LuxR C-terminal-related transcriptional regulator (plasmid) [Metabacillus halosaccharovorans]|uniref:LuxR C-terminal-related transcriptional regulator n=1 Tax=Metabacillus halosaccharovorans TaxID=930124 RepID=UPI001C1FDEF5|nr:response regulator transcription factor [Metabacillus halosaccharovorans]
MMNLLVIDDHIAITAGTKSILETNNDLNVDTLSPPFSEDVLSEIPFDKFDIILMDFNLGEDTINGLELSKKILEEYPNSRIILYTGYEIRDYFDVAVTNGLYGAISKNAKKEEIMDYITHVLNDEIVVPLKIYKKIAKPESPTTIEEEIEFSKRERAILKALAESKTNQEIAEMLKISKRTVEYTLTSIFSKLNVNSRMEAVLIAKSEGLL